jgi:hypothetical protein
MVFSYLPPLFPSWLSYRFDLPSALKTPLASLISGIHQNGTAAIKTVEPTERIHPLSPTYSKSGLSDKSLNLSATCTPNCDKGITKSRPSAFEPHPFALGPCRGLRNCGHHGWPDLPGDRPVCGPPFRLRPSLCRQPAGSASPLFGSLSRTVRCYVPFVVLVLCQ